MLWVFFSLLLLLLLSLRVACPTIYMGSVQLSMWSCAMGHNNAVLVYNFSGARRFISSSSLVYYSKTNSLYVLLLSYTRTLSSEVRLLFNSMYLSHLEHALPSLFLKSSLSVCSLLRTGNEYGAQAHARALASAI